MFTRWRHVDSENLYEALSGDEECENQMTIEKCARENCPHRWITQATLPWIVCAMLAMLLVAILVQTPRCAKEKSLGTFEAGFKTDISSSFKSCNFLIANTPESQNQ